MAGATCSTRCRSSCACPARERRADHRRQPRDRRRGGRARRRRGLGRVPELPRRRRGGGAGDRRGRGGRPPGRRGPGRHGGGGGRADDVRRRRRARAARRARGQRRHRRARRPASTSSPPSASSGCWRSTCSGAIPVLPRGGPPDVDRSTAARAARSCSSPRRRAASAAPASTSTTPRPRAPSTRSASAWPARSTRESVRVNVVRPGIIDTEIHASGGRPDRVAELAPGYPMGRAGTADEVAAAIVWLLSDEASYCTGTFLDVAGGR